MTGRLRDKVAVVTGSGQGIGRAIAIALAKEGAKLVANNRKPGTSGGDAQTTAKEIIGMGGEAVPFFGDVSEFETAGKLVETAVDNFGRIDIVVNNVGVHPRKDVCDLTEEDWDSTVKSHLKSAFNCTRHACVFMIKQSWGRIINCVSASWLGVPGNCSYGAAKGGMVGLTRCAAKDLARYGITCNAYHPLASTRRTTANDADHDKSSDPRRKRYELGFITKEEFELLMNMPPAEAVGPLVAYLATDEASNINGQVFYVAGGDIAIYSEPEKKRFIHKEEGFWTVEELVRLAPRTILEGYRNPTSGKQK